MLALAGLEIDLAFDQLSLGGFHDVLYGVPESVAGQGHEGDRGGDPGCHSLNGSLPCDHESILSPGVDWNPRHVPPWPRPCLPYL